VVALWVNSQDEDDIRRARVYAGDIFSTAPGPASLALCEFAREMAQDGFGALDPQRAQYSMPVEQFASLLSELKPRFIHHARSKELIRDLLAERGCDLDATYFDVPRLRTSTSDGFLTTGIAYAWHPHRDTWYSAPFSQINWWIPVFPVTDTNAMAFHLEYFDRAVANDSAVYNYYVWNAEHRRAAASQIGVESRPLPRPREEIDMSTRVVPVPPVGGMTVFSGQHLHSSVPNTSGVTRFSIDFRTVHIGDVRDGRSARNVDASCTGSSIRDFVCASDFSPMPPDVAAMFDDGTEGDGKLVYSAQSG
jgi:hypothetical protein